MLSRAPARAPMRRHIGSRLEVVAARAKSCLARAQTTTPVYSAGAGLVAGGPSSANAPKMARRSTSAKPASAAGSGVSSETTISDRNDRVIVIRQGFLSGKYHHCLETSAMSFLDVDLNGRTAIEQHQRGDGAENDGGHSAPSREAPPEDGQHQGGKVRRCRDGEREADHVGDILTLEDDSQHDRANPKDDGRDAGDLELLAFRRLATLDHVDPDVMRERSRARQSESGDNRENSRKGNRADEAEEGRAADRIGEQRGRHVAAAT